MEDIPLEANQGKLLVNKVHTTTTSHHKMYIFLLLKVFLNNENQAYSCTEVIDTPQSHRTTNWNRVCDTHIQVQQDTLSMHSASFNFLLSDWLVTKRSVWISMN